MEAIKKIESSLQANPKKFGLWLSVVIAALVAWESRKLFDFRPVSMSEPRVLVANRDLSEDETVSLTDLNIVPNSKLPATPKAKVFSDQELFLLNGKKLKTAVKKGEPITVDLIELGQKQNHLISIPNGRRAYFVETIASAMVSPGVNVDLVLKPFLDNKSSLILVENVLVLSVEKQSEASGVIIALTPDEIEWVERNLRIGRIVLAVRNPNEPTTRRALKKPKQGKQKRVKVEIITEGN